MRGVAAEAGWSTGALNHYFADKEELLLLAFHEVAEPLERAPDRGGLVARGGGGAAPARRRAPGRGARVVRAAGAGAHATRAGARAARRLSRTAGPSWPARCARRRSAASSASGLDPDCEAIELVAFADGISVQASFDPRAFPPRASSRYSTSAWPRYVRGRDGRTASLRGRRPARARPARAAGRGALDPLRAARAGGRLHPHARRARGARDRDRRRLWPGAGRGPRRRRRAAALHPPHRREPRLGARPGLAAPDPLARARELHAEQQAADRRLAALGAERFAPGDRALTHCNAGALATGGLRHRRRRAAGGLGVAGGWPRSGWTRRARCSRARGSPPTSSSAPGIPFSAGVRLERRAR